jgi:hypothetical protein
MPDRAFMTALSGSGSALLEPLSGPPWLLPLLLAHVAATLFMTGLIWFVQIVHYPLMSSVGRAEWVEYERRHLRRTTAVVAPAMLIELGCALLLAAATLGGAEGADGADHGLGTGPGLGADSADAAGSAAGVGAGMETWLGVGIGSGGGPSSSPLAFCALAGLAILIVIWLSTALVQVPLHRRLERNADRRAERWLVGTNWVRTVGWSVRSLLALGAILWA